MKRSKALTPLSHDHHQALVVAMQLKRARAETASEAREAFLGFWEREGRLHYRLEEEVLLPAFAHHAPSAHEAVVRVLTEHVELRRRAGDLACATSAPEELRALGELLEQHIRHEERVLFPLIEEALPERELAELGAAIAQAESDANRGGP